MEIKKLSEEELQQIVQLRNDFANAYTNIGSAQARIKEIEVENQLNFEVLEQIKQKETELFEQLKNTYGVGTIDLETGEFRPIEE